WYFLSFKVGVLIIKAQKRPPSSEGLPILLQRRRIGRLMLRAIQPQQFHRQRFPDQAAVMRRVWILMPVGLEMLARQASTQFGEALALLQLTNELKQPGQKLLLLCGGQGSDCLVGKAGGAGDALGDLDAGLRKEQAGGTSVIGRARLADEALAHQ